MKKIHLDRNHLSFYAIAISSVLILFKVVSTYGENYLKAPLAISGTYQIQSDSLPACLKTQSLPLKIDQSGVFLFAHLANITLDGRMKDNQISLTGTPSALSDCSFAQKSNLKIQASVTDETLVGEIIWDQTTSKTNFIAKKEVVKESSPESH
ncbi:hypothetical protein C7H19_05015 [Aphanothece hegewaldii CCALA 016]|uniref:Uncharacterized protein n=1 Tax=Aphanothece hegewaldii CCALA 016 TaxID=2107694 RepID=A0A2T1M108_9CHRO|nr:hypothetical protein [Aphanothece hegewaldii]PSF38355.1 hypothetical protein C7H19_05015 [Aphanothece hegewaldii CCALA 016]